MTAPRLPSRASSFASQPSQDTTSDTQNAALRGAALAFGRPPPPPRAPSNTYAGRDGALAAAATVGTGSRPSSPTRGRGRSPAPSLVPTSTGSSLRSVRSNGATDIRLVRANTTPRLDPAPPQRGPSKSPSQYAASLAAARAPPLTSPDGSTESARSKSWRPAPGPKPRRLSSQSIGKVQKKEPGHSTDSTPTFPTTSLVDMFERKVDHSQPSGKRPEPIVIKPSRDLLVDSPRPVRTSGGITSMFQMELEEGKNAPNSVAKDTSESLQQTATRSSGESYAWPSGSSTASAAPIAVANWNKAISATNTRVDAGESPAKKQPRPSPSPLPNTTSKPIHIDQRPTRSATSPPETLSPSSVSMKSIPAQYHQLYYHKDTPKMTGDQLADAMVAGSLASSRQASPARKEQLPTPPPRRQKHHTLTFPRTPSPARTGMKKTLRQKESDTSDSSDDEKLHPYGKHKKKRHLRKHPNKHHEGDRKRWREAVTERERKRYEGVWAANKGMFYSFTVEEQRLFSKQPQSERSLEIKDAVSDQISNIIVRDIWNRSRLPGVALETIWDLIDVDSVGRLSKEQFVVGMWLIDQKLKGRKLPVKVSDTLWASVKGLQGIKIKK